MKFKIVQNGEYWYVLKNGLFDWIPLPFSPRSLFMRGTGPFDESPLGFLSREIAQAAIEKYPHGKLCLEIPFMPEKFTEPLLTKPGQLALLNKKLNNK